MQTVEDILAVKGPDVITVSSTYSVKQAAMLMSEANVGSVVVRDAGEVRGIFTERDLLRRIVAKGRDPSDVTLGEAMSSPVASCRLADDTQACALRLTKGHIRHLVVIEEGALVGLISLRDLLGIEVEQAGADHPAEHACAARHGE